MTEAGRVLELEVQGDSMGPALKPGDRLLVREARLEDLRPGEIVVTVGWRGGNFVAHRFLALWPPFAGRRGVSKGDANLLPDPLFLPSGLVGRATALTRGGRRLPLDSLRARWGGLLLAAVTPPALWLLRLLRPLAKPWSLRAFVLGTRRLPPLRAAYRAIYALPAAYLGLETRWRRWARGLYAYRGWTTADWEPGISDVDLVLIAEDLSGEAGGGRLGSFRRRFEALRRWFPFLGECLAMEPREWDAWLGFRPLRARETAPQLKPLAGPALPVPRERPDLAVEGLDRFVECAHAYARLLHAFFSETGPAEVRARQAWKAAVDLLRYGQGSVAERPGFAAGLAGDWRAPLKALRRREAGWENALVGLCGLAAARLHELGGGVLESLRDVREGRRISVPAAEAVAPPDGESRWRIERLESLRQALGPALAGARLDDLYRSYLIFDDAAAAGGIPPEAFAAVALERGRSGFPGTLPVLLSRRLWSLWAASPCLEDPLLFLEARTEPGRTAVVAAGTDFPGFRRTVWWREDARAAAPPPWLGLSAAASWANLRATWRLSGFHGPLSPEYRRHYLLSRAMGLRLLLEKDVAVPFFELDALQERFLEAFPEEREPLARADWSSEGFFFRNYAWLDRQLRR